MRNYFSIHWTTVKVPKIVDVKWFREQVKALKEYYSMRPDNEALHDNIHALHTIFIQKCAMNRIMDYEACARELRKLEKGVR